MPIGVIVNCISVLAGGVIGSALGHVLPNSLKELRLKTKTPAKDMVAVVQTIYPKYKHDCCIISACHTL